MFSLLQGSFEKLVRTGNLEITGPSGKTHQVGDGTGDLVRVHIKDEITAVKILADGDYYLGECYMDGSLEVTDGSIYAFLEILAKNLENANWPAGVSLPYAARKAIRRFKQHNSLSRARRNVAHHYDLSGALYDLFLDRDRQYSCAYFEHPGATLAEAQLAKKRHIAAKLMIEPGMKVLDIGSGWGGLGLYLAETCGANVTGITLSKEQLAMSRQRAASRGLEELCRFELRDYRDMDEKFDRIVSVGMLEHVGVGYLGAFFEKLHSLLEYDGVALVHSIGRANGPGATSAWIDRYIFPGGYIPALSEVLPKLEKSGLYLTDTEILRLHYARTLREWRKRFADHRDEAKALYDERFCRMWEFYLSGSEVSFRYLGLNNFQIQATLHQHALPLTRNYIGDEEERLKRIEKGQPRFKRVARQ